MPTFSPRYPQNTAYFNKNVYRRHRQNTEKLKNLRETTGVRIPAQIAPRRKKCLWDFILDEMEFTANSMKLRARNDRLKRKKICHELKQCFKRDDKKHVLAMKRLAGTAAKGVEELFGNGGGEEKKTGKTPSSFFSSFLHLFCFVLE